MQCCQSFYIKHILYHCWKDLESRVSGLRSDSGLARVDSRLALTCVITSTWISVGNHRSRWLTLYSQLPKSRVSLFGSKPSLVSSMRTDHGAGFVVWSPWTEFRVLWKHQFLLLHVLTWREEKKPTQKRCRAPQLEKSCSNQSAVCLRLCVTWIRIFCSELWQLGEQLCGVSSVVRCFPPTLNQS